jgi:hypothetical protein
MPEGEKECFKDKSERCHLRMPVNIIQLSVKSIGKCQKNPYMINQNHIFSKYYCEVISG